MEEGGRRKGPGDEVSEGWKLALLALKAEEGGPEPTEPLEAGKD